MWSRNRQLEKVRELAALVHDAHEHMTDLITGNDLNEAEQRIKHALKVLQSEVGA